MGLPATFSQFPAAARTAGPLAGSRRPVVAVLIPLCSVILLNALSQSDVDLSVRLLASLTSLVCWVPFAIHVWIGTSGLPFMPAMGLIYGVQFAMPIFSKEGSFVGAGGLGLGDPALLKSQELILLGVACLLVGHYALADRFLRVFPPMRVSFNPRWGLPRIAAIGLLSLVLNEIAPYASVRFSAFFVFLQQLMIFSIAALFYFYLTNRLAFGQKFVLFGILLPVNLGRQLLGGGVGSTVGEGLVMLGIYWLARREWPWKTMAVLAILVMLLQGVKADYRKEVWGNAEATTSSKATLLYQLIDGGFKERDNFLADCFRSTVIRMDQATTFAAVVELTPNPIPYWNGASYATLYWALIPRFIYPDKPTKTIGQDFGHRYGLLGKFDRNTSFNTPQLVEFYVNFGPWGVALGMFLTGLITRVLYYVLAGSKDEILLLLAPVILAPLCAIESDFSLIYGGLLLNIVAIFMVVRILEARSIHLPLDAFRFR